MAFFLPTNAKITKSRSIEFASVFVPKKFEDEDEGEKDKNNCDFYLS